MFIKFVVHKLFEIGSMKSITRFFSYGAIAFILCIAASIHSHAGEPAQRLSTIEQSPVPAKKLRVLTRSVPPFAFQASDGRWQGIAIELWEKIAKDLSLNYEYQAVPLNELIDQLKNGNADMAVGALSVSAAREEMFDFSHPFFRTGIGVAVRNSDQGGLNDIGQAMLSPRFWVPVLTLIGLLLSVGTLVWLAERRSNAQQFPRDVVKGVGAGMWFSSVTMTTVGYGDKAPTSFAGRAVAVVWMFASLILVSLLTASLTASFTLGGLSHRVQSEADLNRIRTGTISGSTSEAHLKQNGVQPQTFADLKAALTQLSQGNLDAVVYDKPLLRYQINSEHQGKILVLPIELSQQDYAIGLPTASPLTEAINRGLLKFGRGSDWESTVSKYLGKD